MKKVTILLSIIFMLSLGAKAQDYDWAIGVRGGGRTSGITVKHNLSSFNALEGSFAAFYREGYHFTGYYDFLVPIIDNGFTFYYGPGAHLGFGSNYFGFGVDAIVGLEYKIPTAPIAFSIDYRPAFNIVEKFDFYGDVDFGFGVQYTF